MIAALEDIEFLTSTLYLRKENRAIVFRAPANLGAKEAA